MNQTSALAEFCAGLTFSRVPSDVIDTAKRCVLDFLGCVLGSVWMEEEVQRLAGYIQSLGDRAEATVLGLGIRTSCRSAAMAHGAMAEVLKFQDSRGSFHPASSVLPAALAAAELQRSSGKQLLAAIVAGYEASMRIGAAVGQSCIGKGFMTTGTVGALGAAVAAGKLLDLDRPALARCLGIAGFMMPFSMAEVFFGGYSVMPMIGGQAARTGIEAALLAANGYTASERVLEGSSNPAWGFCSMAGGAAYLDRITDGLGERYEMRKIGFRAFPCCGMSQGTVEAAIGLAREHRLQPDELEKVVVRTFASAVSRGGSYYPTSSSSVEACQFSIPYLVAAAVRYGELGIGQFTKEARRDPELLGISARVSAVADPDLTKLAESGMMPAILEITTRDGRLLRARVDSAKGGPGRPLPQQELLDKFERLSRLVCDEEAIKTCERMVLGLEKVDDVSQLIMACAGPNRGMEKTYGVS